MASEEIEEIAGSEIVSVLSGCAGRSGSISASASRSAAASASFVALIALRFDGVADAGSLEAGEEAGDDKAAAAAAFLVLAAERREFLTFMNCCSQPFWIIQ